MEEEVVDAAAMVMMVLLFCCCCCFAVEEEEEEEGFDAGVTFLLTGVEVLLLGVVVAEGLFGPPVVEGAELIFVVVVDVDGC